MSDTEFVVEVIYALPERQRIARIQVVPGTTVGDAVTQVAQQLSLEDAASVPVGIFGQEIDREHLLKPGDRVEVYRPLTMDPMTARHLRAQQQRDAGVLKR